MWLWPLLRLPTPLAFVPSLCAHVDCRLPACGARKRTPLCSCMCVAYSWFSVIAIIIEIVSVCCAIHEIDAIVAVVVVTASVLEVVVAR